MIKNIKKCFLNEVLNDKSPFYKKVDSYLNKYMKKKYEIFEKIKDNLLIKVNMCNNKIFNNGIYFVFNFKDSNNIVEETGNVEYSIDEYFHPKINYNDCDCENGIGNKMLLTIKSIEPKMSCLIKTIPYGKKYSILDKSDWKSIDFYPKNIKVKEFIYFEMYFDKFLAYRIENNSKILIGEIKVSSRQSRNVRFYFGNHKMCSMYGFRKFLSDEELFDLVNNNTYPIYKVF